MGASENGAANRRRERRFPHVRHERIAIAMALAEDLHHSTNRTVTTRGGVAAWRPAGTKERQGKTWRGVLRDVREPRGGRAGSSVPPSDHCRCRENPCCDRAGDRS